MVVKATPAQADELSESSGKPSLERPHMSMLATFTAHEHFLERSLSMRHEKLYKDALHPLSPWRVAWRWSGAILLLAYGISLLIASWLRYHCDADEYCDPTSEAQRMSHAEQRLHHLGQGVRAFSGTEVVYALVAPRPASGSLAELASARHLWSLSRLAVPIDALLALPWWELFAVACACAKHRAKRCLSDTHTSSGEC